MDARESFSTFDFSGAATEFLFLDGSSDDGDEDNNLNDEDTTTTTPTPTMLPSTFFPLLTQQEEAFIMSHPWRHDMQLQFDPHSAQSKELQSRLSRTRCQMIFPEGPVKRPHLPAGNEIDIDLSSLFKDEHFIMVCNHVATCSWMPLPNLSYIMQYAPNVEMLSSNTSAISIRVDKSTCRMFTTGVAVFTASRTLEQTKFEAHQYRLFLCSIPVPIMIYDRSNPEHKPRFEIRTLEPLAEFTDFRVVNIVARGIANPMPLDLMNIVNVSSSIGQASWSPEHFPGSRIEINRSAACPFVAPSVITHLFDTGKNMLMGKHLDDLKLAQQFICNWVKPYTDVNLPLNPLNRHEYRKMRLLNFSNTQHQQSLEELQQQQQQLQQQQQSDTTLEIKKTQDLFLNLLDQQNIKSDTYSTIPAMLGGSMVHGFPLYSNLANAGSTLLLQQAAHGDRHSLHPNEDDDEGDENEMQVVEDMVEEYIDSVIFNNNARQGHIIRKR